MEARKVIEINLKHLPLPCPLNQLYRSVQICVKGRMINKSILSARARRCRDALCLAITMQLRSRPRLNRPCTLSYSITKPDKRVRDIDAYNKQLLDCLEASGVVMNDSVITMSNAEMMPVPKRPGWIDLVLQELP